MTDIKFKYYFENIRFGGVCSEIYTIVDIENGAPIEDIENNCEIKLLKRVQDTGLKDKNGVEIYEGDILRCWFKYQDYKKPFIEEVVCLNLNNTLPFSRVFHIEEKVYKDSVGRCEAIGNIYENKELLEVEKQD